MKITNVKMLPYDAEFLNPVFVKVEADEGIHGSATPLPGCAIGARPGAPRP